MAMETSSAGATHLLAVLAGLVSGSVTLVMEDTYVAGLPFGVLLGLWGMWRLNWSVFQAALVVVASVCAMFLATVASVVTAAAPERQDTLGWVFTYLVGSVTGSLVLYVAMVWLLPRGRRLLLVLLTLGLPAVMTALVILASPDPGRPDFLALFMTCQAATALSVSIAATPSEAGRLASSPP